MAGRPPLDGRLACGYRTAHRGGGTDLVGLREYTEGDDARHIDWNCHSARRTQLQLRVFTEDRELTVWLVLDRSASMTVGPSGRGKDDVLSELALVLARLFGRGGNRVGALLYDTGLYDTAPSATRRWCVPCRQAPGAGTRCASAPSSPGPPPPAVPAWATTRYWPTRGHDRPGSDARRGGQAGQAPRLDRGHLRLHRRRRLGALAAAPGAAPRGRRPARHRCRP